MKFTNSFLMYANGNRIVDSTDSRVGSTHKKVQEFN